MAGTSTGLALLRGHLRQTADNAMNEHFETQSDESHRRYEATTKLVAMDDTELRRTLLDSPENAAKLIDEMEVKLLGRK